MFKFTFGCLLLIAAMAATAESSVLTETLRELIEEQRVLLRKQEQRIAALENRINTIETGKISVAQNVPAKPGDLEGMPGQETFPISPNLGLFPDRAIVRPGTFARSIEIPGTELAMGIGGFAQVNFIHDREQSGPTDAFLAAAIPLDQTDGGRSRLSSRNSRFNIDVRGDSPYGGFRAFIEGDFVGRQGNELTTNGEGFRLRHAFGQIGRVYMGQYWSLFADVRSYPETLDVSSPAGKSATRQTGVRYGHSIRDGLSYSVAIENPESSFSGLNGLQVEAVDRTPDLLANLMVERSWGHVNTTALIRRLSVRGSVDDDVLGWGVNLTGRLRTPWLHERDNLVFGVLGGKGMGRYSIELAFNGLDAVLDQSSMELEPIRVHGGYLGYQHWWHPRLRSNLTLGLLRIEDQPMLASFDPRRLSTGSMNLIWSPLPSTTLGVEAIYGRRETQNGIDVDTLRVLGIGRFSF